MELGLKLGIGSPAALTKGVPLASPPPGYGYVYEVLSGLNQIVFVTDASGVSRPLYERLPS